MSQTVKGFHFKVIEKLFGPVAALLAFVCMFQWYIQGSLEPNSDPVFQKRQPPLIMEGGDPYIRALMRTISASEANVKRPYSVLYGGEQVSDLSKHPEKCVRIPIGPNTGNCSTAAGRYQVINTTWFKIAERYHPEQPMPMMFWASYSFEPQYQDRVVHDWLNNTKEWGVNISGLLRQGKINKVLKTLSPTWTSLGYGIETNSVSSSLPRIYQKVLKEELSAVTKAQ